jgi:hypothetical protein
LLSRSLSVLVGASLLGASAVLLSACGTSGNDSSAGTSGVPSSSTTVPGSGLSGTADDWLSAVCKIGTYKYGEPYAGVAGLLNTASCQPVVPPEQGPVTVLQFSSDFMLRNFLVGSVKSVQRYYGFYTTGPGADSAWLFAIAPQKDKAYLAPLEKFGFKIVQPPAP